MSEPISRRTVAEMWRLSNVCRKRCTASGDAGRRARSSEPDEILFMSAESHILIETFEDEPFVLGIQLRRDEIKYLIDI